METKEEMELFHKMLDRKVVILYGKGKTEEIYEKFIKFLEVRIEETKDFLDSMRNFIERLNKTNIYLKNKKKLNLKKFYWIVLSFASFLVKPLLHSFPSRGFLFLRKKYVYLSSQGGSNDLLSIVNPAAIGFWR